MFSGAQHSLMIFTPMENLPFVGCYVTSRGINSKKQKFSFMSHPIQWRKQTSKQTELESTEGRLVPGSHEVSVYLTFAEEAR